MNRYVFSKQFVVTEHYRVPLNSIAFLSDHTIYQFDRVNPRKEQFAMKLKDREWIIYNGKKQVISELILRGAKHILEVTNGEFQLITRDVNE